MTHPPKACDTCGKEKQANLDYFRLEPWNADYLSAACRECLRRQSVKTWRQEHRVERADYRRKYAQENPDKELAAQKRYRQRHPDKCAARVRSRYARQHGAEGTHGAEDVRAQYERQRGKCYWCGRRIRGRYETDHVVPVALDGTNGPENLVVSCPSCNRAKGAQHPMDFAGVLF